MNTLEQKQQELAEAKAAVERIKQEIAALTTKGIWVPGADERYWHVDSVGIIKHDTWQGWQEDRYRLSISNVFREGDKQGPADYIKFMQSIRRTCTYEEAEWFVACDGQVYQGKSPAFYLLGRCKRTKEEAEKWRDEYHKFQVGLCEEPSK